ncbi:LysR family transcriptional regulator, partial [Francisella tularensis subsp. holarctica]|nr:LysR family transcriptional regulator [Francisella tularensis subsp. holarctica]
NLIIKIIFDLDLPQIPQINNYAFNFAIDSYQIDNLNGIQFQFDYYNVIQIFNKHIEYIDIDDLIVCSSVDSVKLPSYV